MTLKCEVIVVTSDVDVPSTRLVEFALVAAVCHSLQVAVCMLNVQLTVAYWSQLGPKILAYFYLSYRKPSSISRTKSQNLNVYCVLLQLSSPNPLKPRVKLRMKM